MSRPPYTKGSFNTATMDPNEMVFLNMLLKMTKGAGPQGKYDEDINALVIQEIHYIKLALKALKGNIILRERYGFNLAGAQALAQEIKKEADELENRKILEASALQGVRAKYSKTLFGANAEALDPTRETYKVLMKPVWVSSETSTGALGKTLTDELNP